MSIPLSVLFIEDSPDDMELMLLELRRGGYSPCYTRVDNSKDMREALQSASWDVIITDYSMPSFSGLAALEMVNQIGLDVPFILVSGNIDDETATSAMTAGAHDYLIKDKLARLVPAITRELREAEVRRERRRAEEALTCSVEHLRRTLEETVNALATTAEKRDPYTAGHQWRVAQLACDIAREMHLTAKEIEGIRVAATLHDIGKISIPAEILSKPGRLTDLEMAIMMTHPQSGYDILQAIPFDWPVATIVLQHQERMNGSGYPLGIAGKELLLESRIIAVADVVEAISSHRPYRPALGLDVAIEELRHNSGILYDKDVVDACQRLLASKTPIFA